MAAKLIKQSCVMVGPWSTDWLTITPLKPHKTITLVITGNPGIVGYYTKFCEELYEELQHQSAVWAISHSCHTLHGSSPNSTVEREVRHKILFIKKYVPAGYKLRLIGHSIGCQMILKALEKLTADTISPDSAEPEGGPNSPPQYTLGHVYMLFPTVERMKDSPRGQQVWPLLAYFWWLPPFIGSCMSILPGFIKEKIVRLFFYDGSGRSLTDDVVNNVITNVTPDMMRNMLDLAYDELLYVTDMDTETVKRHKSRLVFYYGSKDMWCPTEYRDDLLQRVPGVVAYLCQKSIDHAFVVRHSILMAQELTKIVKEVEELQEIVGNNDSNT